MAFDFTGRGLQRLVSRLQMDYDAAAQLCGVRSVTFHHWLADLEPVPKSVIRMFEYKAELAKNTAAIGVIWGTPEE